jgi:DNA sulfur modification protein DndC
LKNFYDPTPEHLAKLSGPWCASFSGGKDSTSLVTWVEWLRRAGWITADRPQLVRSDTGVEDAMLADVTAAMEDVLRRSGWECAIVAPRVEEKLFVQILGRGVSPIHPGIRSMRWCTRATKIDPMDRWRKEHSSGVTLTGLRLGESTMRDGKIKARCSAGGECGIPDPDERTYSPLLDWRTCQVVDWLSGTVGKPVRSLMGDVFKVTRRLVKIYDVRIGQPGFEFYDPEISAARFGCTGCPAIQNEEHAPPSVVIRYGADSPLCELYGVWFEARRRVNRCFRSGAAKGPGKKDGYGPIKLEARKRLFARVTDIQRRAGIVLVTPEDEAFFRQCWADKVYPRGWSEADEVVVPPSDAPLFEADKVR